MKKSFFILFNLSILFVAICCCPQKLRVENKIFARHPLLKNCEKKSSILVPHINRKYTYYEDDSVRIYILKSYLIGYGSVKYDTMVQNNFDSFISKYGPLFERGIISGKMLFCGMFQDCECWNKFNIKAHLSEPEYGIDDYSGYYIKILSIEDITCSRTPVDCRRLKMYAISSNMRDGLDALQIFFIELYSPGAKRDMEWDNFLNAASLRRLIYGFPKIQH
jgi:hypothetical protein